MSDSSPQPGKGLLGWLGRQVGHVRAAIRTDPANPLSKPASPIFQRTHVEESPHPDDPRIKLRRTTIDEAIVDPKNGEHH